MEEEINNIGQKLLDQLENRLAREKEIADVLTKSVSEQQDYLNNLKLTTRTQVLNLDKANQALNAQLRAQQTTISDLQNRRAEILRQQSLIADQGDLFSTFTQNVSGIDAQILAAKQAMKTTQQNIAENELEISVLTQQRMEAEQAINAAKNRELAEIKAAQESTLTRAISRGRVMGRGFAEGTMLQKVGMFADAVSTLGKAAMGLLTSVYDVQRQVGVELGTAVRQYSGALIESAKSLITGGPIVSSKEVLDATAAFTKEFGTILNPKEAGRIAREAKNFGITGAELVKAKRAFLSTGAEDLTRNKVITEFKKAGLTAAQALKFAADNANLIAIAGSKYADSLARAAANATKIGVSLSSTERFADSIVGDFEGALMGFAEAAALGIKLDANEIFRVAATGGPEAVQRELASQLGGNQALIRELQTNRFLKLGLQQALPGLDINEIIRLSGGPEQKPAELTVAEQSRDYLAKIVEILGKGGGIAGGISKFIGGALEGGTLGGAVGAAGTLGFGAIPGAIGGALIGGTAALLGDDIISSPGYGNRALLTQNGVIGLNNKDTVLAGTQLLSAGSLTQPTSSQQSSAVNTVVSVDVTKLETKLDKVVSAISNMKVMMDANTVGKIVVNSSSPIDLATA